MRLFSGLLISTLALGTIVTTGCSEHRYSGGPYYGSSGYYGYNDPYYREWLAERRYNYIEYNRLNSERQREYWEWRHQNEARFRNDPRFRENQRFEPNGHFVNHDRDDHTNTYARTRNGDKDRHRDDRNRHDVRKDRDKDHDKDRDRDHDRR